MSKNLETLNTHIFNALDKLANCKDAEETKLEIQRCNAITNVSKAIIEEIKVGVEVAKLQERGNDYPEYMMPSLLGTGDEE